MAIPTAPPGDFRSLIVSESDRLLSLLRSLTPAEWGLPTPCPGWSVHGLATHLLGGSLSVTSWLRDGHRGASAPVDLDEGVFISWLDELQQTWVEAARRVSPRLLIELLEWSTAGLVEAFDSQDPGSVSAHVSWTGADPVPVWLDHGRELSEKWIHRQQILEAVGRPTDLRWDLASPVLETLRWAYPFRLGSLPGKSGSFVEIDVTDERGGTRWCLVSNGSEWEYYGVKPVERVAAISLTSEQASRLLTNNYVATVHGTFQAAGDPEIVEAILNTRAIVGIPK